MPSFVAVAVWAYNATEAIRATTNNVNYRLKIVESMDGFSMSTITLAEDDFPCRAKNKGRVIDSFGIARENCDSRIAAEGQYVRNVQIRNLCFVGEGLLDDT
jgi:hypothetical protein